MILKLEHDLVTRLQVDRLLDAHPGVTEIDWNGHGAYSSGAIDVILRRLPDVKHTGMSEFTKREFGWVMHQLGLDDDQ